MKKITIGDNVIHLEQTETIKSIDYVYSYGNHTKEMEEIPVELKHKCIFTFESGKTVRGLHLKIGE